MRSRAAHEALSREAIFQLERSFRVICDLVVTTISLAGSKKESFHNGQGALGLCVVLWFYVCMLVVVVATHRVKQLSLRVIRVSLAGTECSSHDISARMVDWEVPWETVNGRGREDGKSCQLIWVLGVRWEVDAGAVGLHSGCLGEEGE